MSGFILKTRCDKAPWWKVIWVSLKVRIVHSNPEKSSCLNTCVLLRRESIVATRDPSLSLSLLRDEQRVSLGEFVDGRQVSILTVNEAWKRT
jgi:hypothetical protein